MEVEPLHELEEPEQCVVWTFFFTVPSHPDGSHLYDKVAVAQGSVFGSKLHPSQHLSLEFVQAQHVPLLQVLSAAEQSLQAPPSFPHEVLLVPVLHTPSLQHPEQVLLALCCPQLFVSPRQ